MFVPARLFGALYYARVLSIPDLGGVDPLDEEVHRKLGDLWLTEKKYDAAIREYAAVVSLKPIDPAASHFNLARAYRADGFDQPVEPPGDGGREGTDR